MASISNGLVLTTAMVVSTTVLYLAFSRHKIHYPSLPSNSNKQILRSCLCSEEKRREKKKMKKRVKFAENVMVKEERESDNNNNKKIKEEQRMQNRVVSNNSGNYCRNGSLENGGMPENRVALYKGMLRDRGNRIACCH